MAGEESGLKSEFKKKAGSFLKHAFSIAMVGMMVSMALPAVSAAAAAVGTKATLGDIGLAIVDHYKTMFTAPFTEFGTLKDIASNAWNGNFAASSYELGAHAAHGATATHAATAATHTAASSCAPFTEWQSALSPESLDKVTAAAAKIGKPLEQYYTNNLCMSH